METGFLGLPIISVSQEPQTPYDYEVRVFRTFFEGARSNAEARERKSSLELDEQVAHLAGKSIFKGSSASQFDLDHLVAWWLWRANSVGVEEADNDLESFLDNDRLDCLLAIWVYGLNPTEEIKVTEQVRIVPAAKMPDSREKELLARSMWRNRIEFKPLPSAAIVADVMTEKVLPEPPGIQSDLKETFQLLDTLSLLLNALNGVCCVKGHQTSYSPPHVPLGPFGGAGGGFWINDVLPQSNSVEIDSEYTKPIQGLIDGFRSLSHSWKETISRSLSRLTQAKCRSDLNGQALDLGIALEMVLLHSENKNTGLPGQLSNQFRLRGAWLLGETLRERERYYRELGEIYNRRSQVAHNGVLTQPKGTGLHDVRESVAHSISLAEKVLYRLIVDGPPADWTAVVLGKSAESDRPDGIGDV